MGMKKYYYIAGMLLVLACSGCASSPSQPTAVTPSPYAGLPQPGVFTRQDIYHIVAPGETLWRISKAYDVPMYDITRANSLDNDRELLRGQRILIPKAAPVRPIIPLFPSDKWKYIIIHHTATDEGSALLLDESHKNRGWKGLGYHFVIDNTTQEKPDGHLEASIRWLYQENGAHCKASGMNSKGIGIALVGNFNNEKVSQKQFETLVYTVNALKNYYNIPLCNIMGHRDVPGANTECPGRNFPWQEFIKRLR
jgi:N-acetylmuramoyl-L-alanine amidase